MQSDGNTIRTRHTDLQDADGSIRAEVHALIDRLEPNILVSILPVLQRYAGRSPLLSDSRATVSQQRSVDSEQE